MDSNTTDIGSYINELKDGNFAGKEKAARALESLGAIAIRPLIEVLRCCRREVKFYIINILGNIGGQEALAPLSWVAFGDKNHFFRRLAMLALGDNGDPKALPILIQGLEDESAHVRMAAGCSLGKLKAKQSRPALEAALAIESVEQVKRKYREAIEEIHANGRDTPIQTEKKKQSCLGKELCEYMGEERCPSDNRKCRIKLKEEKAGPVASHEKKKTPSRKKSAQPGSKKEKLQKMQLITKQEGEYTQDMRQKTDELIRNMRELARQTDAEIALMKQKYPQYFIPLKRSKALKTLCVKR